MLSMYYGLYHFIAIKVGRDSFLHFFNVFKRGKSVFTKLGNSFFHLSSAVSHNRPIKKNMQMQQPIFRATKDIRA